MFRKYPIQPDPLINGSWKYFCLPQEIITTLQFTTTATIQIIICSCRNPTAVHGFHTFYDENWNMENSEGCLFMSTAVQHSTAEKPIHQRPTNPPCVYNSTAVQQYGRAKKKKVETETRALNSRSACPESTAVPPRTNKMLPFSVFSRNFLSWI